MKSTTRWCALITAAGIAALLPVLGAGALELKPGLSLPSDVSLQAAPAGVAVLAQNGGVQLSWTPAAGATSYNVYQGTSAGGEAKLPVRSGITGVEVTLSGLQNDKEYFFRVSASGAAGESAGSVEVRAIPFQPIADAPDFSVAGGVYTSVQHVSIRDKLDGASLYYTTDGTLPTTASAQYGGALTIDSNTILSAIALVPGHSASGVTRAVYTINLPPVVDVPVFSVLGGTYSSTQYVEISDGTQGASIFYTTDGSDPTSSSTPYSGKIQVAKTTTLKAIATANNFSDSPIASVTYAISPPPASGGGAMGLDLLCALGALLMARRRFFAGRVQAR